MIDKAVQEYIQHLNNERLNLELTIVELKRQLNELTDPKETSDTQGPEQSS